ncbi:MAG: hypothetical protein AAFQ84_08905 [Pseudomonadota bacterium]
MTEPSPTLAPAESDGTNTPPRRRWAFWRRRPPKEKRPVLIRLFGLSIWGTFKLILICILVGFVMLAMQFDPASPTFNAQAAVSEFAQNTVATARWAVTNFWKPALNGATIVLPIWVLWRLLSLPFRR